MLYFQKPFISIHSDGARRLGHVKWGRFENSYEYRSGLEAVLALAYEKEVINWVIDLSEISPIRPADQHWTAHEYLPQFFSTNLQKIAIIGAEDFFSHISITRISNFMLPIPNYIVRFVPDLDAALNWIDTSY